MPRILLLVTDLEIGGTPSVVRELAVRLGALCGGADGVRVACLGGRGPVAGQMESRGVEVAALGARGVRDVAVVGRLHGLIQRWEIDTVFSFLVHANALAAAVGVVRRDVRWLQSIQTTQPEPRWHWQVQRLAGLAAEKIVVPSRSVAEAAMRWSGVARAKLVVIPNAVDARAFEGSAASVARPGAVGFVGRLDPVKRVPDLLAALARLEGEVTLDIYGEGAEGARIRSEIERLGLGGRVTMHGAVEDVRGALSRMGVLALPSAAEGFGLVLIEAMAAGVPVVATDVPGIRDVVRHGVNGLLVPPRDPAALAAGIERVIGDAGLRERLKRGGGETVRESFAWERVIRQYARLLRLRG